MPVPFALLAALLAWLPQPQPEGRLQLRIVDIEGARGNLMIALYDQPEAWLEEEARHREYVLPLTAEELVREVEVRELAYGTYAVAVYHDENANGKLDANWLGIPTEPYAFSKNPDLKWRRPKFEDAAFTFERDGQELTLRLARWKGR